MLEGLLFVVLAAALAAAAIGVFRAARVERRSRKDLLAGCTGLLEDATIAVDQAGYGVLRGRIDGVEVALRPFSEALAFRRLPQLWLAVTVRLPGPGDAVIDVLRRPNGAEFYAPAAALPMGFATPPSWPRDAIVRGSRDAGGLLDRLAPALALPLADDRLKEMLVTPRGLRIVRQLRQGERSAYLLFRDSRFRDATVKEEEAAEAITVALSIARAAFEARRAQEQRHDGVEADDRIEAPDRAA